MELKDVILSTLAEMENDIPEKAPKEMPQDTLVEKFEKKEEYFEQNNENSGSIENELIYLNSIRERLLVLFEGFQAPNNSNIEAKVDMTLNFLEYTLATIDERVEKLQKGKLKNESI